MLFIGIPFLGYRALNYLFTKNYIPELTFIALSTFVILFFLFFLFGVMFDVQENKELHK